MTEKEKMLKKLVYDANYDIELLNDRNKAKDLCFEFNNTKPSDTEQQVAMFGLEEECKLCQE